MRRRDQDLLFSSNYPIASELRREDKKEGEGMKKKKRGEGKFIKIESLKGLSGGREGGGATRL